MAGVFKTCGDNAADSRGVEIYHSHTFLSPSMAQTRVFSLLGQTLKLDTRADIETHLAKIDKDNVEEIILGGNTIGVEASLALAEVLKQCRKLKASLISLC